MRITRALISSMLLLAVGSTATIAEQAAGTIPQAEFLVGGWGGESNGRWTEERWTSARGGMMLGTSRTGREDRAEGFDFMRIQAEADGTLVFWGSPQGAPAVPFRLKHAAGNVLVFENPEHDFPNSIRYEREAEVLVATIAGKDGKDAVSWRWERLPD